MTFNQLAIYTAIFCGFGLAGLIIAALALHRALKAEDRIRDIESALWPLGK